ncbi:tape measure protein [Limosilactobacillus vaginalis]|uniref:tape measure protein n=1 Tax=Limosilactobacillus vaginalis TaxID=1633 RepID=UPI0025A39C11|nr:tape measure protein [Limosilactobacillus vaginalis]MDM8264610.1 tape measure protein [Limosilactobacillus vaginalis]
MKVQNEMSTRISVDAVSAVGSLSAFRNAIRGTSSAWRAQEVALKNSGKYTEAAATRYRGLNKVIDLQKAKIEELRSRQEGLNTANEKQAGQYLKLESQIQSANKQLASYESQMDRAKNSVGYYASGLGNLQHQMKLSDAVSRSYVAALRAQGKTSKADRAEFNGLRESLSNLEKQQAKQQFLLKQVANQSGKTSDAYRKQQIELNRTSESIAKAKTRMEELNKSLNPPRTSSWGFVRNEILRVDEAEKKARTSVINYGQALKANILGGWISSGLTNLTTGIKGVITNGMAAAKVGAAMEARWKNIGLAAGGVKQLSTQVGDLKTNTYLSAQSVNALQTRFYGMTHSIQQTKVLTQSVGSLTDKLKLSEQQSNAFAGGLARIESSGKVSSRTLGRLEKQAPGLTAALQKASGMSKKAFSDLLSSGKMTADQFNQLMIKASGDYKQNAKAFSQTSGGAMHKLRAEWVTTQAKLAKPLLKVSSTGLNELSQALNNKDTQRGLQMIAKGMANVAVDAAKFIGFLAKHQTTVKVFGTTILGLAAAFKTMQGTVMAVDVVKHFAKLKGTAKIIELVTRNVKTLGTAVKIATLGFNPWVMAIEAVVAGFTLLYKHSKKFRNFVNGLANDAKKGMKAVGKWFSSTFKSIAKAHQQSVKQQQRQNKINQRNWNNFTRAVNKTVTNAWKTIQRNSSNGWHSIERNAQRGTSRVGRWYQQLSKNTQRTITNMARNHPRTFGNMYRLIQDRTRVWHDVVSGHWSDLGRDTGRLASDASRTNRSIFKSMYDDINDKTDGGLGRVVSSWQSHMSSIGDAIKSAAKHAAQAMADLANLVLKPFKILIDDIQGGINWILDKVGASKLGGSWSAAIPTFATGTAGNPDGLKKSTIGMVNDGAGSHWREMYSYKGHVGIFPNKRNFITFLPKGMSILNGEDSHKLMNMMGIPHFANGIGDFFSGILSKSEDILENVDKILEHPIEFAKSVFDRFTSHIHTNIKFAASLVKSVPSYVASKMAEWIKKQFQELADPAGSGVARWRPYVLRALKMLNLSESLVGKVLKQIQTESGGNSKAMGGTDGLADGHAEGLMQVKPGTFNAYKLPGHNNIWNGFDNLLAGLNYAKHRYGSDLYFLGQGHGYANGGVVSAHGLYEMAEQNRPEMIIPLSASKRSRAYQLLSEVMAQFKHEDNNGSETHSNGGLYDKQDFVNVQRLIDELNNGIKTLISLQRTQIAVTKAQGKFDPRQQYIQQAQALSMKLQQY